MTEHRKVHSITVRSADDDAISHRRKNGTGNGLTRWIAALVLGAVGGIVSFWLRAWWVGEPFNHENIGDPVSIANTYIVFTTAIVTVAAIIITVVGLALSVQITKTKISQANEAFDYLKESLEKDEIKAVGILDALIENPDVQRRMRNEVKRIAQEQIRELAANAQKTAESKSEEAIRAQNEAAGASALASRIAQEAQREEMS